MVQVLEAQATIRAADLTGGAFASVGAKIKKLADAANRANGTMAAAGRRAAAADRAQNVIARSASVVAATRGVLPALAGIGGGRLIASGVTEAAAFERAMTRIRNTANATAAEQRDATIQVKALAQQVALPFDKARAGLETLVAQGRSLPDALAFMPSVLRSAQASGAEVDDIAKSAEAVATNFKIAGSEMQTAFDIMVAGGKAGQFELKDMARYIPSIAPAAAAVGMRGKEGLADLVAMFQVIRKGSGTAEEANASLSDLFQKMESDETVKKFKKFGVDVPAAMAKARAEGRNLVAVFEDLIQQATKGDISKVPMLAQDREFSRAIRALMTYKNEWQKLAEEMRRTAPGSVANDLGNVLQDTQAKIDRLTNSWGQFKSSLGDLAVTAGAANALQFLGEMAERASNAMKPPAGPDGKPRPLPQTVGELRAALLGDRRRKVEEEIAAIEGRAGPLQSAPGSPFTGRAAMAGLPPRKLTPAEEQRLAELRGRREALKLEEAAAKLKPTEIPKAEVAQIFERADRERRARNLEEMRPVIREVQKMKPPAPAKATPTSPAGQITVPPVGLDMPPARPSSGETSAADLAAALKGVKATVEGPVTAEVKGSADVNVKVQVAPSPDFLTRIQTMINNAINAVRVNGAPATGSSGSTGRAMPEAAPGAPSP